MEVKRTTSRQEFQTKRTGIGQGRGARHQYTSKGAKPGHVSPAIVEKYLAGMHFPAGKSELVSKATNKDAPDDVMQLLHKLPNKTYKSPIDITKEIGKIE